MNYSAPRRDKTLRREEAQPRKQVPRAETCLLMASLGWGWAGRAAGRGTGAWGAGKAGINQGRPATAPQERFARLRGWEQLQAGGQDWKRGPESVGVCARAARVGVCVCLCTHAFLPARVLCVVKRARVSTYTTALCCVCGCVYV